MRAFRPLVLASIALPLLACIVEAPTASEQRPRVVASPVGAPTAPAARPGQPIAIKVGANFENKVELAGMTVEPGVLVPGEQVKVSLFFQVRDAIPTDYTIFVHVEDVDGRLERMNIDHPPAGGSHPTSEWKKGETVRDEFGVYLPPGATARALNLWVGFWDPKTDGRLKLSNPQQVRNDGNNRIALLTLPVAQ